MSLQLKEEALRCLMCKNPRCSELCPVSTPIPEIIKLYREEEYEKAGEILFENNPLSVVCSIICPHEDQCLKNCVRGIKGEPIHFYEIEQELSLNYLNNLKVENVEKNNHKIGIVGGGPAGITIAFILAKRGFNVTIFENRAKIGGVLRYGIPEYRLSNSIIDKIGEKLEDLGVEIRPNIMIGSSLTVDRLLEDGYCALFIGTGVWNARKLNIKGETLGNVHYAIDYLKSPGSYNVGNKVCIIGGGNVAMDAARTAKRSGADEVYIVYRKDFQRMPATKKEIEDAKEDGVEFKLLRTPKEILKNGLKVCTSNSENEEELIECDTTIIAIGQEPCDIVASSTTNLETDKYGLIITDKDGHTTKRGVFASGDVVTGAKTVVAAVAHAKDVADAIEEYCNSKMKN